MSGLAVDTTPLNPSGIFAAVTPSDSTVLTRVRRIYVGGAGTLVCTDSTGTDTTFTVPAGAVLPITPVKIKAASTATLIVALK